jgi:tetratricopeptide (TPR) repeat protein
LSAGRISDAIELYEEILEIQREVLGPKHPNTVGAMGRLGNAYWSAGQISKAIELCEQTFELKREVNGPTHPHTLWAMNNLANAYASAGRFPEAIKHYKATLEGARKVLGPEHPNTLTSMGALAQAYQSAGQIPEAIKRNEEVYELARKVLGPKHPNTLKSMNNLALAYKSGGQIEEAIELYEKTLELEWQVLGAKHPSTFMTMHNLRVAYASAGRVDKAIARLEAAYAEEPEYSGLLVEAYAEAGEKEKALALMEVSEGNSSVSMPAGGLQLAAFLAINGRSLLRLEVWDKAENVIRECLEIREQYLPDSLLTANTQSMLGEALLGQGKLDEAEPLLLDGYKGMKQREADIPPEGKIRLTQAVERLVKLYETLERPDEAAKWRALLPAESENDAPAPTEPTTAQRATTPEESSQSEQ